MKRSARLPQYLRACDPPPKTPSVNRSSAYVVLFIGLVLVSTSGPFLVASGIDTLSTVVLRLGASGAIFLVWAAAMGALRPPREEWGRLVLGAVLLAAHLGLWVKAFDLTDYASTLLLLVTQPVIAAMLGHFVGEPATRTTWISVGLAVVGLGIIAGGDVSLGPRALLGDALAVLGAGAIALFFLVTKRTRTTMPMPTFLGWTMGLGAVLFMPVVLISGSRLTGYSAESWAWMAALVLLTTVGGHGLMNLVARHVKLFTLQVVIVLEPPIGIAMGAAIFGAGFSSTHLIGGVILTVAVIVGLWPEAVKKDVGVESNVGAVDSATPV